jgi:hypothetical protein
MTDSNSTQNAAARVLVCERSGRWATALRRELTAICGNLEQCRNDIPGGQTFLSVQKPSLSVSKSSKTQDRQECLSSCGLAARGIRVIELRSLDDCRQELSENPASFVIVEFEKNIGGVLRFLANARRRFPQARLAAAADFPSAECEASLREAGAVHVLRSPRDAKLLVRLVGRHFAQIPSPPQSMRERIGSRLPWGGHRKAAVQ